MRGKITAAIAIAGDSRKSRETAASTAEGMLKSKLLTAMAAKIVAARRLSVAAAAIKIAALQPYANPAMTVSNVRGARSPISSPTGWAKTTEYPRFPRSVPARKRT
jgi:hypothetical protein